MDLMASSNFQKLSVTSVLPSLTQLGQGGFGTVYRYENSGVPITALKVVEKTSTSIQEEEALRTEMTMLKSLQHDRIVKFYCFRVTNNTMSIFMEYMPMGSIADFIRNYGTLCVVTTQQYTRQMLEGLHYLHSSRIVHGDIKGANVLIFNQSNIKLADFGLAQQLPTHMSAFAKAKGYSPPWAAPELFRKLPYGFEVDIWSLGCTIVEMLTGKPPAYNPFDTPVIPQYQLPPCVSNASANLIRGILNRCFRLPTALGLFSDPFLVFPLT